jgi:peptidoglycan hydrolase CwlO-like protein
MLTAEYLKILLALGGAQALVTAAILLLTINLRRRVRDMSQNLDKETQQVGALGAEVHQIKQAVDTRVANLQAALDAANAEIQTLKSQNPSVDTSALDAALSAAQQEVDALQTDVSGSGPAPTSPTTAGTSSASASTSSEASQGSGAASGTPGAIESEQPGAGGTSGGGQQ